MGVEALMKALPLSGILAESIAGLTVFLPVESKRFSIEHAIEFLEPPAGQRVPFVNPVAALTILLRRDKELSENEAAERARQAYSELRPRLPLLERPRLFEEFSGLLQVPECVPVCRFTTFLRERGLVSEYLIDFLDQAADVTGRVMIFFNDYGNWKYGRRLSETPDMPPPFSMFDALVGLPGMVLMDLETEEDDWPIHLFLEWKEKISPAVERLERELGKEVYYFSDPDCEWDDDISHRYLALHCICSLLPDSNFVQYLVEVTDLPDVEALKAALLEPSSYYHPFDCDDFFSKAVKPDYCRFRLPEKDFRRRVGILFHSAEALLLAEEIALQQIGVELVFLTQEGLIDQTWMESATLYAAGWRRRPLEDVARPVELLATLDGFYVIYDEKLRSATDGLGVSPEVEILLWRALQYGIDLKCYDSPRSRRASPESCLEKNRVPEKVALLDLERKRFLEEVGTVRLSPEFGGSGLWTAGGRSLGFDQIDIPFAWARRLAAWRENYDLRGRTIAADSDDNQRERSGREKLEIARGLQEVWGDGIHVQIEENGRWVEVCQEE